MNDNPYLGIPNNYIKHLLPEMIEDMFKIVIDPYLTPKSDSSIIIYYKKEKIDSS